MGRFAFRADLPYRIEDDLAWAIDRSDVVSSAGGRGGKRKLSEALISYVLGGRRREIPERLAVDAATKDCAMSGYVRQSSCSGPRKRWKRFWFVVKNGVLYQYRASHDKAAKDSLALVGFQVQGNETDGSIELRQSGITIVLKPDDRASFDQWTEKLRQAASV